MHNLVIATTVVNKKNINFKRIYIRSPLKFITKNKSLLKIFTILYNSVNAFCMSQASDGKNYFNKKECVCSKYGHNGEMSN